MVRQGSEACTRLGYGETVKVLAALKVFHTPPTNARTFQVCAAAPKTFVGVLEQFVALEPQVLAATVFVYLRVAP